MEIWKEIKGYEGLYEVSNLGRIKSIGRKNQRGINKKTKILKCGTNGKYLKVMLCKNKIKKVYFVHRLVAQEFIFNSNKNILKEVNHINGIKTDNRACNLEWCTRKQNVKHSIETGLVPKKKGSLLNKEDLYQKYIIDKKSIAEIAKEYNYKYSTSTINRALKRNNIKIRNYTESARNRKNYLKAKLDQINFEEKIKTKKIKEIAEELNINCDYLYHYLNNKNIYKLHKYNRKDKVK